MLALVTVAAMTLPAFFLQKVLGYRPIALIFLMVVVILALFVGRGPTLLAATLSAVIWDFFFLAPIPSLRIQKVEDAILFVMYFVVALVLGQLTARIRGQERRERQREALATALYLLTDELSDATDFDQMMSRVVRQISQVFRAETAILLPTPARDKSLESHPASALRLTEAEHARLEAFFAGADPAPAGRTLTDVFPIRLEASGRAHGLLALRFAQPFPLGQQQRRALDAFARQIAVGLDRRRLRRESEEAKLMAESERLNKSLLDSISHEIRTPLAAIKSAAGHLEESDPAAEEPRRAMLDEIHEATDRLDRLVGNLLDTTRLESGHVKLRLELNDLRDLVPRAVAQSRKELRGHKVAVHLPPGLPLVRIDYVLMQQALMNLLSNAAAHTPAGTVVRVSAAVTGQSVVLTVADRGPGLAEESLPRVFDKFYRGPGAPTGGSGLGLYLVKGFVEAHGGTVRAANLPEGGAAFTIRLPLPESPVVSVELDE